MQYRLKKKNERLPNQTLCWITVIRIQQLAEFPRPWIQVSRTVMTQLVVWLVWYAKDG